MGDFTRAGDIDPGVAVPLRIGDCWVERDKATQPAQFGRVWIADLLPVENEPSIVVTEDAEQRRARMKVAEFRKKFMFRSR
jgi:hypothetical protein